MDKIRVGGLHLSGAFSKHAPTHSASKPILSLKNRVDIKKGVLKHTAPMLEM